MPSLWRLLLLCTLVVCGVRAHAVLTDCVISDAGMMHVPLPMSNDDCRFLAGAYKSEGYYLAPANALIKAVELLIVYKKRLCELEQCVCTCAKGNHTLLQ